MDGRVRIGTKHELPPIPIDESATRYFDAGSVKLGVERRELNEDVARRTYTAAELADVDKFPDPDQGPSIHVCDAETGFEYLRFDCFEINPHYHYLSAGSNISVAFDAVAQGEMVEWTLVAIEKRLREMLIEAGAPELAIRIDQSLLDSALAAARPFAQSAPARTTNRVGRD